MARKNANGRGSVGYDKSKRRYVGRLTVRSEVVGTKLVDGREVPVYKQVRRTVSGRTQAEVYDKLEKLQTAVEAGPGVPADSTVGRYLAYWVADVLPLSDLAPTTRDQYARILKLYVAPTLDRVRLDQLGPTEVRRMISRLRDQDLSPATIRQARSVLSRALRDAERDGLTTRNAARLVDGVRQAAPQGRTLTAEQARTLLSAAEGTEYEALVPVLLSLGLRKGEALGLGWHHIDLDASPAKLSVRRALKKDGRGGLFLDEPKTARSRRTVHLPGPLVAALQRHRERQAETRDAFGTGWGGRWEPEQLVFTNSVGGPLDPDRVNRHLQALAASAGLGRWTPHELRHSAASLLLAQGVPLKVVSETLGHSSIRVTADVYGHLLDEARAEAASAMESALWGNS